MNHKMFLQMIRIKYVICFVYGGPVNVNEQTSQPARWTDRQFDMTAVSQSVIVQLIKLRSTFNSLIEH